MDKAKEDPEDSAIDCIDLNETDYESVTTVTSYRSASPQSTVASEFADPDHRGRSKVGKFRLSQLEVKNYGVTFQVKTHSKSPGPFSAVQTVIGSVFGIGSGSRSHGSNPKMMPEDPDYCHHCETSGKNQKKVSCWAIFIFLAIDLFTIILLLALYSSLPHRGKERLGEYW